MPSSSRNARDEFSRDDSDALADQVHKWTRLPERRGWTKLAVWYEGADGLMAVAGEHEGAAVDKVLAHGLFHAAGRPLTLVLPEAVSFPTRFRQPWLTAAVDVWTHREGEASRIRPLSRQEARRKMRGHPKERPHRLAPEAAEWVRRLSEWATEHAELADAHTQTLRGWAVDGQRVLTIGGKRVVEIKAGVDAMRDPAHTIKLRAPLPDADFDTIKERVTRGINDARSKTFGHFEEHHLQVRLRRHPNVLRLEHPLLREVPAWRPSSPGEKRGRGFVDLVGLDSAGDIVLVETKLGQDEMLVLQGLDYWIWATDDSNAAWLRDRLYAAQDAQVKLLYAVGGKRKAAPRLGRYELSHLALLDPEIEWRIALLEDWHGTASPRAEIREPRTKP